MNIICLNIISLKESVFRNVRIEYNLRLSAGDKENFNNGVLVVGTQEVSARRVRKVLINYNLYLFVWPLDQFYFLKLGTRVDYGWPLVAKFKK